MNFKEALIAHLQGEKVEVQSDNTGVWRDFGVVFAKTPLATFNFPVLKCEFRIAPETIIVNGVEVPAPESVAPAMHMRYLVPSVTSRGGYAVFEWKDNDHDRWLLENGLVYYGMDACIARAKSMLITKEV